MSVIENLIITSTLHLPEYSGKIYPVVKPEYFESDVHSTLFSILSDYHTQYKSSPSQDAIELMLEDKKGLVEPTYQSIKEMLPKLFDNKIIDGLKKQNQEFLINKTEKYIKERAAYNVVLQGYQVITGTEKKIKLEALPDLLKSAVSISFDTHLGHDYLEDAEKRYEFYHEYQQRIPFALSMLNYVTNGGLCRKTLNLIVAGTGIGKTLFMTDYAAFLLKQGYNVAYFSFEMQDYRIGERIDAKLMDVTVQELKELSKDSFLSNINNIKKSTQGRLKVLEYPNGSFTAIHMKNVLNDLKNKGNFTPDIIFVDYLTLMASYRLGLGSGTYSYAKAIAEELRALAMAEDVAIFSASQTNRNGQNAADIDLTEIADSAGISHTCDSMFALISTAELAQLNHVRIKQLKNRYGDVFRPNSFLVGVERSKMSFYDVDLPDNLSQPKQQIDLDDVEDDDILGKPTYTGSNELVF